jgi:hypothetical protein
MAHPSRRVPSPNPPRYYAVPQSPQNYPYGQGQQRRTSRSNRTRSANGHTAIAPMPPRNDLAQGVATGAIGAGYGPYAVHPSPFPMRIFRLISELFYYQSITLPQYMVTPLPMLLRASASLNPRPSTLRLNGMQLQRTAPPSLSICGIQKIPTSMMRCTIPTRVSTQHKTILLPCSQAEVGQTYPSSSYSSLVL